MLLTITNTQPPAADISYLLFKRPDKVQTFELGYGKAHVFYPEANDERCTVALLLDIDAVGLVRDRKGPAGEGGLLAQYVNDRPYVASSFMSVAIVQVFRTAMTGRSESRANLAATALPLKVRISALPCRGGEAFLRRLFEPLGYSVTANPHPLDEQYPDWGSSRYYTVELEANVSLADLLTHLYVLIPVLDDDKHYWVSSDEVEKLLAKGAGWLAAHPEREAITQRYLRHKPYLTREALARLAEEDQPDPDAEDEAEEQEEEQVEQVEQGISLNQQRLGAVIATLKGAGAGRVLDLGCGEGRLLQRLLDEAQFSEIVGMDVSYHALEKAKARLRLDKLPSRQQGRIKLLQGSLVYRDERLRGYDAAAVVEVIEHLDPPRLAAFERALFEFAHPATVAMTTPNAEYNVKWESLAAGNFRHRDHRFEWSRAQFQAWAQATAEKFGYNVRFLPIGDEDPQVGAPTQMAVFTKEGHNEANHP